MGRFTKPVFLYMRSDSQDSAPFDMAIVFFHMGRWGHCSFRGRFKFVSQLHICNMCS